MTLRWLEKDPVEPNKVVGRMKTIRYQMKVMQYQGAKTLCEATRSL
ncbi:MAG: hypothetical protein M3O50_10610 [Myxococcota bacterium]|nr:hypothetical protein [Myxococcota bacterium]